MKQIELIDSNGNYKGLILITIPDKELMNRVSTIFKGILDELGCKVKPESGF